MQQFFNRHNPFAHQMLLTNLLGAAQRGHWQASAEDLAQVAQKLAESVMTHGPACEANQCRNAALTEFVGQALAALPDAAPLLEGYGEAIARAATGGGAPQVSGQVIEDATPSVALSATVPNWQWWLSGLASLGLFLFGWWRGAYPAGFTGSPRLAKSLPA
jgi:cobaltochelatase CobN